MTYICAEDLKQLIDIKRPCTYEELKNLIDNMTPLNIRQLFEFYEKFRPEERKVDITYDA